MLFNLTTVDSVLNNSYLCVFMCMYFSNINILDFVEKMLFLSTKFRLFWEVFRFLSDSARGKISLCDVITISIVILIPCSFSEKSNSVQTHSVLHHNPKPPKRKSSYSEKTDTSKYFWSNYPDTGYIIATLAIISFSKFLFRKSPFYFENGLFWQPSFKIIFILREAKLN